ncbi:uncharacterized protein LOC115885340 [Sitophilus oryzae]|uniref:Uncharacterized protein LOC115885340 n=1 Tax=Sitophilus oryzae TaxID=7048 RepID=A0A6J2Y8B5_SITOR|nr:uncharacterized protein LOC115885340 [Sitophilus oryzae]
MLEDIVNIDTKTLDLETAEKVLPIWESMLQIYSEKLECLQHQIKEHKQALMALELKKSVTERSIRKNNDFLKELSERDNNASQELEELKFLYPVYHHQNETLLSQVQSDLQAETKENVLKEDLSEKEETLIQIKHLIEENIEENEIKIESFIKKYL